MVFGSVAQFARASFKTGRAKNLRIWLQPIIPLDGFGFSLLGILNQFGGLRKISRVVWVVYNLLVRLS